MIDISLFIALLLIAVAGMILTALQLPGTWLVLAAAWAYNGYYHWQRFSWGWLIALTAVAVAAEVFEMLSSLITARKAGASRRAAFCGLIGGFAGMLLFSIPLPIVGTILGGLLGCFLGALAGEMTIRDDLTQGVRVGVFAALGRLLGLAAKLSAAGIIGGVSAVLAARAIW